MSPKNSFQSEMRSPHRISSFDRNLSRSSGRSKFLYIPFLSTFPSRLPSNVCKTITIGFFAVKTNCVNEVVFNHDVPTNRVTETRCDRFLHDSCELITQERVKWFLFQKDWINSRGLELLLLQLVMRNWMLCSWTRILRLSKRASNL